jgi:hypothetical protein
MQTGKERNAGGTNCYNFDWCKIYVVEKRKTLVIYLLDDGI